jgi:dihydroneopterin aldolase
MVQAVHDVNQAKKYLLIESFADDIANAMLERFPRIQKIAVRVEKLAPMGLGTVRCAAVELERERQKKRTLST